MANDNPTGAKVGLSAATDEAMKIIRAEMDGSDAQLALLPVVLPSEESAVDGSDLGRGPGRPPGARNKRTEEWTAHILSKYRSPLEFLASTYTRSTALLAAELRCSLLDAFKMQLAAAKELSPYLHQKQPVAIDLDTSTAINLALEISSDFAGRLGLDPAGDGVIELRDVTAEPVDGRSAAREG